MKTQLAVAFVTLLSLTNVSHAVWDEKSDNELDMQIAKQNSVSRTVEYLDQQTGKESEASDYVSEIKLVSATSKDSFDALPATFEVTLFAPAQDGSAGRELIRAEVKCQRGRTDQVSRFTRVTHIDCSVDHAF